MAGQVNSNVFLEFVNCFINQFFNRLVYEFYSGHRKANVKFVIITGISYLLFRVYLISRYLRDVPEKEKNNVFILTNYSF